MASGPVCRTQRPNTWLHRPTLQTFKKVLANSAPSTHGPKWTSKKNASRPAEHRSLIVTLAARHKLPAIYYERSFIPDGGLISYGPDFIDQYHRAATYVDRILKGEKPADLPVQAPTKYELRRRLASPFQTL
jgi:hypothetical protein